MSKSVAILAMGHSLSNYFGDFESNGYARPHDEVWGVNSVMCWLGPKLLTHGIAMDNFNRDLKMDGGKYTQYVENMVTCGLPIIADVAYPEYPNVEAYPLKEVLDDIWPGAREFSGHVAPDLENTINFAIALAIHRKFEAIYLYGCDFRAPDNAYTIASVKEGLEEIKPWWFAYHDRNVVKHRRDLEPGEPTTMFLLGVAYQRGIHFQVTPGSTLCNMDRARYFYGYQEQPKMWESDERT